MKKLLILPLLLSFSNLTSAQTFSIGMNVGASISEIKYDGESSGAFLDSSPNIGLNVGIYSSLYLLKNIGIRAEVNFARKGEQYKNLRFGSSTTSESAKTNLDYVQIPILIEASGGNNFRWVVNAGLSHGYLTKAENVYSFDLVDGTNRTDVKERYQINDNSLVVGTGCRIKISDAVYINLESRYSHSQNPAQKDPTFANAKNRSVSILTGISYSFGK